jgi:hypothetical protein
MTITQATVNGANGANGTNGTNGTSTHSSSTSSRVVSQTTSPASSTKDAASINGDAPQDKLVVAVDFGTTFSGVAFCYSGNPDDLDVIKSWPGGNGIGSDKVPTEIAYEVDTSDAPQTNGTPEEKPAAVRSNIRWGFQFKPEEPRLRCIKLFLDRNQKLPHFVSPLETAAQLRKCDRTVMDGASDYLTKIYEHTMDTMTRRYGESFMSTTKVDFVLTVPAVW